MNAFDYYRGRIKAAGWTWMERNRWYQGRAAKDRVWSRVAKRSARQKARKEDLGEG